MLRGPGCVSAHVFRHRLTVLIPGCDFNFLTMENPVSWILTAWFSSVTILMFGERVSACGGSWKEWPVFGRVLVPFFTYYGTHSLTVMCTHLVPVIAFFKVAAGRMMYPGVLGSTPWDILLLAWCWRWSRAWCG